jgi:hypothetical protein
MTASKSGALRLVVGALGCETSLRTAAFIIAVVPLRSSRTSGIHSAQYMGRVGSN